MRINPKKTALIGLAATTLFSTTGCGVREPLQEQTIVYGPPVSFEERIKDQIKEDIDNIINQDQKDDENSEELNPEDNMENDVYGPPVENDD